MPCVSSSSGCHPQLSTRCVPGSGRGRGGQQGQLGGKGHEGVIDALCELKFRLSPTAFYQVCCTRGGCTWAGDGNRGRWTGNVRGRGGRGYSGHYRCTVQAGVQGCYCQPSNRQGMGWGVVMALFHPSSRQEGCEPTLHVASFVLQVRPQRFCRLAVIIGWHGKMVFAVAGECRWHLHVVPHHWQDGRGWTGQSAAGHLLRHRNHWAHTGNAGKQYSACSGREAGGGGGGSCDRASRDVIILC